MKTAIKVLYLLHDSRRSGVPAVASAFIKRATMVGVKPTVLFAYNGIYASELKNAGVPTLTLGSRTPFLWRFKRFLMNVFLLLKGKEFDVVHIHSVKLACSVLVARLLGLKAVFHLHELPRRVSYLLRLAMASADCVVFCSETCAAHFDGIPARKKKTIVNAMAFGRQLPTVHSDNDVLPVVMVASLNRNKGQHLLLKAFSRLRDPRAQLWLYGTTGLSAHGYTRYLKRYAAKHGIADRVFMPGPTSDVFSVFSNAAVVVHPSSTESFGMALVEAQSCGVPVIAHDLEGMREVVKNDVTGYLVSLGDVEQMARRLEELLSDAGLRNRMGAQGYRMVRECFDIESRIPEYRKLYEDMVSP